eukprot:12928138-Prorocentrum_lima.AAC.1
MDAPMPDATKSGGALPPEFTHGYECYECKRFLLRDGFMPVLAMDGTPEKDWEGKAWGRCYTCEVGDGPYEAASQDPWFTTAKN